MSNDVEILTREELKKGFTTANPNRPEFEIDKDVERFIENTYGDEADYRAKMAASRAKKESEFDPGINEDGYKKMKEQFDEESEAIKSPEALDYFELSVSEAVNRGVARPIAEAMARQNVINKFGDAAFNEPESDPLDKEIARLEDLGFYLVDRYKRRVKSLIRTKGLSALDAMRRVGEEEGKQQFELTRQMEKAGSREAEYHEALSISNRRVLAGLQASQPEANWTAKKLYKSIHGKELPKSKSVPKEPEEPTVTREEYERERQRTENLINHLTDMGYDRAEIEAYLEGVV